MRAIRREFDYLQRRKSLSLTMSANSRSEGQGFTAPTGHELSDICIKNGASRPPKKKLKMLAETHTHRAIKREIEAAVEQIARKKSLRIYLFLII